MDPRRCLSVAIAACAFLTAAHPAGAEEIWQITGGRTAIHLYDYLLQDLGMEMVDLNETAPDPTPAEAHMEPPFLTFAISGSTDLTFRTHGGRFVSRGFVDGAIHHTGGFGLRHATTGYIASMQDFVIDYLPQPEISEVGVIRDWLFVRGEVTTDAVVELMDSEPIFDRGEQHLDVYNLTLFVSEPWAEAIGRPDLVGQAIGTMAVEAESRFVSGVFEEEETGNQAMGTFLDVELGHLYDCDAVGHEGTYPNGTAGLGMSTTSCNPGDVPVNWHAPMEEDHPIIAQQFYRVEDGTLEQIGVAWVKHGFYALSSNECNYGCSPSNGTFLGVGCSDTYGVGNNSDRYWLGPREEVNPYTGEWACRGSFFAEYQDDCIRRESGNGWGPVAHRIEVADSDLGRSGASYFFEGYYVVRGDQDRTNNISYRECTTSWGGSNWNIGEFGNMTQDPIAWTWGDQQSIVSGIDDGALILSVRSVDVGGGSYRYEYALYNRDSDRQIRELQIPVGNANVSNVTFHDWDADDGPGNDWDTSVAGGFVTWFTDTYAQNPDAVSANALSYGLLFTFTFVADAPPQDSEGALGFFRPGTGDQITAATQAPGQSVAVGSTPVTTVARLAAARPNPLSAGSTTIGYELTQRAHVTLDIYDLQGRQVRSLVTRTMSVGTHRTTWDGRDAGGHKVAAGVYLYRLSLDGKAIASRSLVIVE